MSTFRREFHRVFSHTEQRKGWQRKKQIGKKKKWLEADVRPEDVPCAAAGFVLAVCESPQRQPPSRLWGSSEWWPLYAPNVRILFQDDNSCSSEVTDNKSMPSWFGAPPCTLEFSRMEEWSASLVGLFFELLMRLMWSSSFLRAFDCFFVLFCVVLFVQSA